MPQSAPPELAAFVKRIIDRLGTTRAVANAIGITEGRLGRVTRGEGSMEIPTLLRLAELAGEHPSHVLRLAGKGKDAELIERIYGVKSPPLTQSQRNLLDTWERLSEHSREHLRAIMRDVLPRQTEPPKRRAAG